jgi:hypothetical protein
MRARQRLFHRSRARRALAFACVVALAVAAPALAADRVDVAVGPVGVDVSPGGAAVNVDTPAAGATVNASPSGVTVEGNAAGAPVTVEVPLPPTPAVPPPSTPDPGGAITDPGGAVGDVVKGTPVPQPGRTDPPTGGGSGSGAGSGGGGAAPTARGGSATDPTSSGDAGRGSGGARGRDRTAGRSAAGVAGAPGAGAGTGAAAGGSPSGGSGGPPADESGGVTRTLERVVEVIPLPIWIALVGLTLAALVFFGRGQVIARRARRLAHQREQLLHDVGLLQEALLPEIPAKLGELATSVAYRPADGPAAGGDFYDAFLLDGERVAIIVGDVSGHGRAALARTALMRYTLRAYLDAGLEPRRALAVAGRALDDDLGGDFATVVVAIHDPARATLTYASAGHPPPIVCGSGAFEPITALSSPPIGAGLPTGQRQTTLHLPGDAVACFFTDGLVEARRGGELIGRDRLAQMVGDLGPEATAAGVIDAVAAYADETPDDMATCVLRPDASGAADHVPDRVEEVEVGEEDLDGERLARYLAACAVEPGEAAAALQSVEASVREFGGALLRVRVDKTGARCEVESPRVLHDQLSEAPPVRAARGRLVA